MRDGVVDAVATKMNVVDDGARMVEKKRVTRDQVAVGATTVTIDDADATVTRKNLVAAETVTETI